MEGEVISRGRLLRPGLRRCGALIAAASLVAASTPARIECGTGYEMPAWKLEEVLERLHRVASLYRDGALGFACRERISYQPANDTPRVFDLEYIYEYDDRKGLHDYRTRPAGERDKGKVLPEVSLKDLDIPTWVMRAYSIIFTFQRGRRDAYRYRLLGEEETGGRHALVVQFEPAAADRPDRDDWFGRAWVDAGTYQPLRFEALKADQLAEKNRLQAELTGGTPGLPGKGLDPVLENVIIEFSVEKNGMRFPGRVLITRSRFHVQETKGVRTSQEHPIFRVEQTYTDYRFYGVRTSEEIRDRVSGGAPSKDPGSP